MQVTRQCGSVGDVILNCLVVSKGEGRVNCCFPLTFAVEVASMLLVVITDVLGVWCCSVSFPTLDQDSSCMILGESGICLWYGNIKRSNTGC
jgi:hypothetical protein